MIKNLPEGWRVERVKDIIKIKKGKKVDIFETYENGLFNYIDISVLRTKKYKYTNNNQIIATEKDILIVWDGANSGYSSFGLSGSVGSTLAKLSIVKTDILYMYFGKFIDGKFKYLNDTSYGATIPHLQRQMLENINVPIPPLPQQEKIVKVLDLSSALVEKQEALLKEYNLFLKSKFIEMFGDPITNPMGWEVVKLGTLMKIRRGSSPRPIDKFIGKDVPWIKIGDGSKGNDLYIEDTKVKIIKEGVSKSVYLKKGSLIFANCGVSLGFSRILKIDGCIHDGWLSFEDIDDSLNKLFILKLINHSTKRLRDSASGGTQPNLNIGIMKNFKIYLPPIPLQNKFAQIVEKIEKIKTQESQKLIQLQTLHKSLMDKAFKGEIE